jgi:hypothetical protein
MRTYDAPIKEEDYCYPDYTGLYTYSDGTFMLYYASSPRWSRQGSILRPRRWLISILMLEMGKLARGSKLVCEQSDFGKGPSNRMPFSFYFLISLELKVSWKCE